MPVNYKDYPKDWKKRSLFIRKYRAKDRCEKCGVRNGDPTGRGWKVVLTVAHLFDSTKKNGSFLNLAALCQKCHLDHDKYHHSDKRRRKFKDPVLFSEQDMYGPRDRKRLSRVYHPKFVRRIRHERNSGLWFLHGENAPE